MSREVTLTKMEQAICKYIVSERKRNNSDAGVKEKKVSDQSSDDIEIDGYGGEIAFCRLFNLFPDFTTHPRGQDNDFGDCISKTGKRIDVKTTKYETGKLICALWKNNNVDVYVLMTGTFPNYTYRGYATAENLKRQENIKNLGRGELYVMDQNNLSK